MTNIKSSHQRCSTEKVALKSFAMFTGKHMPWSHPKTLILNTVINSQ